MEERIPRMIYTRGLCCGWRFGSLRERSDLFAKLISLNYNLGLFQVTQSESIPNGRMGWGCDSWSTKIGYCTEYKRMRILLSMNKRAGAKLFLHKHGASSLLRIYSGKGLQLGCNGGTWWRFWAMYANEAFTREGYKVMTWALEWQYRFSTPYYVRPVEIKLWTQK